MSEIGLGALEVGRRWGIPSLDDPGNPPDEAAAVRFLNDVLDSGVNLIDTAAAYWLSEERIGKALSGRRSEFVLASKWGEWCDESGSVYDYSPAAMWKFLDSSLTKLNTDVIDLYQIHSAPLEVIQSGEALAEMQKAREQGRIRFIGLSCGEAEALAAIESGGYDTIQISYNALGRSMESRVLPMALSANMGVLIKDGLAAGRLTDKIHRLGVEHAALKGRVAAVQSLAEGWGMTLNELALRFVLSNPAVSSVLAGTRSVAHLLDNIRASDGRLLTPQQMQALEAAA